MKQFDEKLGAVLKAERKHKRMSQQSVADRMCVTKMTISHWESGKRSMTAKNLKEYCSILNISVQDVLDQTGDD